MNERNSTILRSKVHLHLRFGWVGSHLPNGVGLQLLHVEDAMTWKCWFLKPKKHGWRKQKATVVLVVVILVLLRLLVWLSLSSSGYVTSFVGTNVYLLYVLHTIGFTFFRFAFIQGFFHPTPLDGSMRTTSPSGRSFTFFEPSYFR